jgi:hypothetical protein
MKRLKCLSHFAEVQNVQNLYLKYIQSVGLFLGEDNIILQKLARYIRQKDHMSFYFI